MNRIEKDKMFFDEAKRQITNLKEQNKKMHEVLKDHYGELRKHPEILDDKLYKQYKKIESILKEIS